MSVDASLLAERPPNAVFRAADRRRRWIVAPLALAAIVAAGVVGATWFANAALADMRRASAFAISGDATALYAKLQKFRLVPVALSTDPELRQALEAPSETLRASLNQRFEEIAAASGAAAVYLIDSAGIAYAASNYRSERSWVGQDYSFRDYFTQALINRDAEQFAIGTVSGEPGLYLSRSVFAEDASGVIVVKLRFEDIEASWRGQNRLIVAADSDGTVLVTPDERLRLKPIGAVENGVGPAPPAAAELLGAGPVLANAHPIEQSDWFVASFEPLKPALSAARLAGGLTGSSLGAVCLGGLALLFRRQQRQARHARELAAYRAQLEAEVRAGTNELRTSYEKLTAETARRERAQADLRVMQDEIAQLNRLAILGQSAAKVAHEINQPLTAMRNYVENSVKLLALGDNTLVAKNLETMAGLTMRAGRIIDELRAFSKRRPSRPAAVAIGRAIDGALLIAEPALRAASIALNRETKADGEQVCVDQIRIEQVVVNLLQNAIDALHAVDAPRLHIETRAEEGWIEVRISDNGPGVEAPEDLFVPFRSGKENGLGLGLSISTEILSEYGGTLSHQQQQGGGALFVIRLPSVRQ